MSSESPKTELLDLTATIVAAYVSHNSVQQPDLGGLIRDVYATLSTVTAEHEGVTREEPRPAISVKRSVTADYIVCLEDGKKFKSLKRHLRSHYNLSPEEYREKWNLPHDYPMVAPNYAEARSQLAKKMGLGTRREK
jgi:predicted transcriptional regulator